MGLFDKLIRKKAQAKTSWRRELADVVAIKSITPAKPNKLVVDSDSEAHLFHSTSLGFALYFHNVGRGSVLTIGDRIPLACMFEAHWLTLDGEKIGYLFTSHFQVTNKGGYIMTYMNSGAGKASSVEVLVKTDTLVVYSYPNHGCVIVSPHVGDDVRNVLSEQ